MDEENGEVYNHFLKLSKPTEEDFERVFTDEELKKLCLKHVCRVDMYRWNAVNNYRILFTESGRYQRWSESDRLGMLAKAVNRFKPDILYTDEEISKDRKEDWEFQLKENILSLNYWLRKESKTTHLEVTESAGSSREMQSQFDGNRESMVSFELDTQSESVPTGYIELDQEALELEVHTESMNMAELLTQSRTHQKEFKHIPVDSESMSTEEQPTTPRSAQIKNENIPLVFLEAEYVTNHDSEDSIETVLHQDLRKPVVETLHSEEVAPEIANMYDVNSLTMSIDSQMPVQYINILQSEEVVSPNYEDFKNIIPLTSTQSQTKELEDIIVS